MEDKDCLRSLTCVRGFELASGLLTASTAR